MTSEPNVSGMLTPWENFLKLIGESASSFQEFLKLYNTRGKMSDIEDQSDFEKDLERLINRHSVENDSNTPDFILAQFIRDSLVAFNSAVFQRDRWYGIEPRPGWRGFRDMERNQFSFQELRITLTSFAMWLLHGEPAQGREVELVDKFIQETTAEPTITMPTISEVEFTDEPTSFPETDLKTKRPDNPGERFTYEPVTPPDDPCPDEYSEDD